MIPVEEKDEPANFDLLVRQPGQKFLAKVPKPTSNQWGSKMYWQKALPDMRIAYDKICAYCACWIPHSTGSHSIDHFIPKAKKPELAYEWKNFRYVSARFNSRKGMKTIADPFTMESNWFVIDFSSFFVKANIEVLNDSEILLAKKTIITLKLNTDDELVKERQSYFDAYRNNHIDFSYLVRCAPFIALEMKRQNLL